MNARNISLFLCTAALVLFSGSAIAQNASGTIVGHVKDPNGAAIVAAQVSVTNLDTHDVRTVSTNGAGDYTVPLLQPGRYQVTVMANGFKSETQAGIVLNVDQTVRVETTLTVGSATESITVSTQSLALDTDSAGIGQLIGGEEVAELPLNGRNFQDLMFLSSGAVNNGGGEQSVYRLTISGTGVSSVSVGGSRGSSNGYTVDGTSILDIGYDTPMFGESLDDIAEFDLLSKSYSAAYGYSMNQVNITSKSGTNTYHGSAFEYLRNNYVDAFAHGIKVAPLLQQNQFGYSLGGPVRIPWLYNGRNKTFFFANYEGFRQNTGGGGLTNVPQADEMKGKFDANVLGNFTAAQAPAGVGYTQCGHTYHAGDPHPLFNPWDPKGCPFPVASDGSYTIPASSISNLGKLIMQPGLYFPAGPNVSGAALSAPNYSYSSATTLNFDQQNYRIDQNIGSKDQIFFHAVKHDELQNGTADTPVNAVFENQPARLYTATETHTFSANFTNQIRLGYSELAWANGGDATITPAAVSSLNWPNPFKSPGEGYPRIEYDSSPLNNGLNYGGGGAFVGSITSRDSSVWDLGESAIWSIKRHTLSLGFGGRRIIYAMKAGGSLGRINYNGEYSGDNFADSLLGASPGIAITELGPLSNPNLGSVAHVHFTWWAPYVQDDWKVNDKLTMNLGLRYEFIATPFEEQNSFIWPDFSAPGGALYHANAKTASAYGGVNPFSPSTGLYVPSPNGMRGPGPAPKNDWAPRIGFAYRVFGNDKTVVRGGFGKYFDTIEADEYQAASVGIYPNTDSVGGAPDAGLSYPPLYNTNSLPAGTPGGPLVSNWTNPSTSQLGFLQVQAVKKLNPYVLAWNLGVERELPWATKLEVDYVANHGTNLFSRSNPNAPVECIAINGCTVTANTPATATVAARTPYQNLGTLIYAGFDGISNYDAMDIRVEHRSGDLDLVVAYTWSAALDDKSSVAGIGGDDAGWAGPQDGHSIASDYGRSAFDDRQRLALTAVYPLPIGKGRAILGNSPRLVDEAIGGWKFSVISSFQGGLPFTVAANDIEGANATFSERANLNPTPAGFHRSLAHWYSHDSIPGSKDATFTQPAPGYFGNSERNNARLPGIVNADLSLDKRFAITEKAGFGFRFDAFNAFNHWNPGQPDSNVNDANAGVIFQNSSQTGARILQLSGRFTF